MNTIKEFFETKLAPLLIKMNASILMRTIMAAFMGLLPLTIAGAFAALVVNLPIDALQSFLTSTGLGYYLSLPIKFTTEFMGTIMSITVAYSYLKIKGNDDPLSGGLLSLVAFLILTPAGTTMGAFGESTTIVLGTVSFYDTMGIFSSIAIGMSVGKVYDMFVSRGLTIKMPESVPPFIAKAFKSMVPGFMIIISAVLISFGFSLTPFGSVHAVIYGLVQLPLQGLGGTFGAVIIVALVSQILWFFGIHGSAAVLPIIMPIWMSLDAANLAAYAAGEAIPNIISMVFFSVYTPGGFGISVAILLYLAKSKRYKTVGKLSVIPAAFNITEPVIFGVPLVMNPIFFIPFVFSNVISLTIAYALTVWEVVPRLAVSVPTGTPIILGGLIAGGWKVAILQLLLIVLVTLFWIPFVRYADKKEVEAEQASEA